MITRAFASPDARWLDRMMSLTADVCVDEAAKTSEIGCGRFVDGTGVETYRYGMQERPLKKDGDFKPTRVKTYQKWHILAAVGLQIPVIQDDRRQRCGHHGFSDLLDGTGYMS